MRPFHFLLWTLLMASSIFTASAQYALDANALTKAPYSWYDQKIDLQNSGLVNGEYAEIRRISKSSHQFYQSDSWSVGTIFFRGQLFDSVYMTYDVNRDLLLIRHPTQYVFHNQAIKPIQQHISSFDIFGHHFVRMESGDLKGFYDELYIGKHLKLIAKRHKKSVVERSVEYELDERLYFFYNGTYHQLKNKSSIIKVLSNYKKEIKGFVRNQNLLIKRGHDQDCIKLIEFLDEKLTEK